jgi:hypothetical protein
MSTIRKKKGGMDVFSNEHTNSEQIATTRWCPCCLQVGISVQLTPRIYIKEELIDGELPHDAYDWLECRDCGHKVEEFN